MQISIVIATHKYTNNWPKLCVVYARYHTKSRDIVCLFCWLLFVCFFACLFVCLLFTCLLVEFVAFVTIVKLASKTRMRTGNVWCGFLRSEKRSRLGWF